MFTGTGTDINNLVCGIHGFFVVFNHQQCVTQVAQVLQGCQKFAVITLMQADRRLVQNVQHANKPAANLRGKAYALRFAAA